MRNDLENLTDGYQSKSSVLYSRLSSQAIELKREEIIYWISRELYNEHHNEAKKEVLSGTGQWLLSDPLFSKWKKESVSSILWLHGVLGSGKSKLV